MWKGGVLVYYVQSSRCRIKDNEKWLCFDSIGWLQHCHSGRKKKKTGNEAQHTCQHAIWTALLYQTRSWSTEQQSFDLWGWLERRRCVSRQVRSCGEMSSLYLRSLDKVTLNSSSVFMLLCIHNCASVNTLGTKTWHEREGHGCLELGSRKQRWKKATSTHKGCWRF